MKNILRFFGLQQIEAPNRGHHLNQGESLVAVTIYHNGGQSGLGIKMSPYSRLDNPESCGDILDDLFDATRDTLRLQGVL